MTAFGPTASALDNAAALRARELSAVELLDACLAAVDELNPTLNAIVWRNDDEARAQARTADERLAADDDAPFLGVPLPIKDLNAVEDQPVTFGSGGAPDGVADYSDLSVLALRRAGFVLCGRSNTPEFGLITATENSRFGITRNPWNTDHTPGGSSGGAAAAVAGGMFPIAHASDGGGSIRIPASYCGLVGHKVSRGRMPTLVHSWLGAAVEGVESRTVADTAAALDAMCGFDPLWWYNAPALKRPFADEVGAEVAPLRIGLMAQAPGGALPTDPECVEAARSAAELLAELGHDVSEVEVPTLSAELIEPFVVLTAAGLGEYEPIDWDRTDAHIHYQHDVATKGRGAFDYVAAAKRLEQISRREVARWGRDFDVLVTPTAAGLPPLAGETLKASVATPTAPVPSVIASVAFTAFGNVTGLPSISLPLHWTPDGLPVGVLLTGPPFDDALVLRLAAQLEQARPWADKRALTAGAA
jgi:amidase